MSRKMAERRCQMHRELVIEEVPKRDAKIEYAGTKAHDALDEFDLDIRLAELIGTRSLVGEGQPFALFGPTR
jgi:hypothetical protein